MQESKRRLGGAPETPEESANTIEDLANFFESVVWTPIILLLRWPLWPAIERTRKRHHHSATYGELERLGFEMLCTVAFICQLLIIWTLGARSVMAKQLMMPDMTTLAWFLTAFFALTVIRICFWMRDNLST